jgi:hypothetical protein
MAERAIIPPPLAETSRGNESAPPSVVKRSEIYHSENGDRWLLCRDGEGRVFVLHKANNVIGGTRTKIELGDFLARGKAGPEHQALVSLIGSLLDKE